MFPHDNIRKTFTVMHNPVFEESDALSFVLLACIILYINGKQFKCSVFTFVQYIKIPELKNPNTTILPQHTRPDSIAWREELIYFYAAKLAYYAKKTF